MQFLEQEHETQKLQLMNKIWFAKADENAGTQEGQIPADIEDNLVVTRLYKSSNRTALSILAWCHT